MAGTTVIPRPENLELSKLVGIGGGCFEKLSIKMEKPHFDKGPMPSATAILKALKSWQTHHPYNGLILDKEKPFFSPDGNLHQIDAGWALKIDSDSVEADDYPVLCPGFAVRFTSTDSHVFEKDKEELLSLRNQGCELSWLIEPQSEFVYVFQPGCPLQQIPTFDYYLDGRHVLDGFEFPLRNLRYESESSDD